MNKRWRKILLFVVIPVAIAGALFYWLTWSGSNDHIVSVANQFKADSSWKLISDHSDPPRTLCIAQKCPQLSREWSTNEPVSQSMLDQAIKESGWTGAETEAECLNLRKQNPKTYACPVHIKIDGYTIVFYANDGESSDGQPTLSMHME